MPVPGLQHDTIFSGKRIVKETRFIRPIHPKTAIAPTRPSVKKAIDAGWWAQPKIHGHRAQIHVPADATKDLYVYNRQGALHAKTLPEDLVKELRRLFTPTEGWNVIDAEWLKPEGKIFVFDYLRRNGGSLDRMSFAERYELLPRVYNSDSVQTLPVYRTVDKCMEFLGAEHPDYIEGLVFRSPATLGFPDSAIVRCRFDKFA